MSHYIERCKTCGIVMSQCRCMSCCGKEERWSRCDKCVKEYEKAVDATATAAPMAEQCCGTCKWLMNANNVWGNCTAPAPDSIQEDTRTSMLRVEGANCPLWKPKENPE